MLKKFLFYGILGWVLEVVWTGLGSFVQGQWTLEGHTYLWMFPIYGLAIFLEPIHDQIRDYKWWVRGLVYMTIILVIEYFTGYLLEALVGQCPWDYSGKRLSVNGYIRLDYAPVWFLVGLFFELVHDKFVPKLNRILK